MEKKFKIGASVVALVLLAALTVGCSKDSEKSDTTNTTATTVSSSGDSDSSDPGETDTDTGDEEESDTGSLGSGAVLASGEAPADRTIMMSDTGFSPDELTIKVGENVTFKSAGGTFGVIVGDLDGATVSGGLIETFEFPVAGTYVISEDINGYTGTITVE